MKLFKLIASRAGQVLFDDRVEADSPREAREQMKALLGLNSLTGVVYAITEIPVDLIQSIVDARLAEEVHRLQSGRPPQRVEDLIRPIAAEVAREQLASLHTAQPAATVSPPPPARYDAFTSAVEIPVGEPQLARSSPPSRTRRVTTADGRTVDWRAVRKLYRRTGSIKQTAARFELSINSVKARIRREGWTHE